MPHKAPEKRRRFDRKWIDANPDKYAEQQKEKCRGWNRTSTERRRANGLDAARKWKGREDLRRLYEAIKMLRKKVKAME